MKSYRKKLKQCWQHLKKVAVDTLECKQRLGEYAVVWCDSKPIATSDVRQPSK